MKKIIIVIILIFSGILLTNQIHKNIVRSKEIIQKAHYNEQADDLYKYALFLSRNHASDINEIEKIIVEIETEYYQSNTFKNGDLKKLKQQYKTNLTKAKENYEKYLKNKELEKNQWCELLRKQCGDYIDAEYWYEKLTEYERKKILSNEINVNDRDIMVLLLPGDYEMSESKSKYGTDKHFYGKRNAKYRYLISRNGFIDFIAE